MKTTFAFIALSLFVFGTGFTNPSYPLGDPIAKFNGDFSVMPTVMHKTKITGKIALNYGDAGLANVAVTLDLPILGKTSFLSKEQYLVNTQPGGAYQMGAAWKLAGPSHKWYFVFVGGSPDNGQTVSGSVYRVDDTLENIQKILDAGVTADPANWKKLGDANFKAVP